jgi:signal transduction histidine kinase
MVNADIALIQRVFANLIANAIKFAPEQVNVSIVFTVENSSIKISVKGTGCGVSESDLPHIVERHYFKPKYNEKYSDRSFSASLASEGCKPMPVSGQKRIKEAGVNNSFQEQGPEKEVVLHGGLGQTALYNSSSGIGLAIVKKILELHNSNIQVTSLAQKGADFQFLLPVMSTKGV